MEVVVMVDVSVARESLVFTDCALCVAFTLIGLLPSK